MTIGIRIRNKNSQIVVNDQYYNLMLRQKIVGVASVKDSRYREYHVNTTINCSSEALVAIRISSGYAGIVSVVAQSDTQRQLDIVNDDAFTADIYIFDSPEFAILNGKIGLRVRNRNTGKIAFDSRGKYMKILGSLAVTVGENSGNVQSFSGFDKLPAVVQIQPYRHDYASTFDTGTGETIAESGSACVQYNCNGNNINCRKWEWRYRTGSGFGGDNYDFYTGSNVLLFLDVTGY